MSFEPFPRPDLDGRVWVLALNDEDRIYIRGDRVTSSAFRAVMASVETWESLRADQWASLNRLAESAAPDAPGRGEEGTEW